MSLSLFFSEYLLAHIRRDILTPHLALQIDLDTIDVTNLNRQFLFQKEHVGQSKAVVAGAAVKRMNPRMRVTATHGNIMEPERDIACVAFRFLPVTLHAMRALAPL